MAQTPRCDLCPDEDAHIMWTSFADGSSVAVGPSCTPAFVSGLATSLGFVMLPAESVPAEMGGTLELPGMGDVLAQGNDAPPKRKRGARKAASEPIPTDEETDEPTDEPVDKAQVDEGVPA